MLKNRRPKPDTKLKSFKPFASRQKGKVARVQFKPIRKKSKKR